MYEQLLEWLRAELVPMADPGTAVLSWRQLRFLGDIEDYLRQLDQLSIYFLLPHETLLAMAAEPLGSEAVSAIYRADQMYGPGRMPYTHLRKFLQSHLQQITFVQCKQLVEHPPVAKGYGRVASSQERKRRTPLATNITQNPPRRPLQAHAYEANTNDATRRITYATSDKVHVVRKYSWGLNLCWVCGTDQHTWYHCNRKKKGRCAVCGSEGHLTRVCA